MIFPTLLINLPNIDQISSLGMLQRIMRVYNRRLCRGNHLIILQEIAVLVIPTRCVSHFLRVTGGREEI